MSDTIIVGIISASSVMLGLIISQIFELFKRKSEAKRWYSEFFLGRKIDALSRLYLSLVECHYTLNFYGNLIPQNIQEFKDKIEPKKDEYFNAFTLGSLYLDKEQEKAMSNALGAFRQASMAIWLTIQDCPVNKDSYPDSIKIFDWKLFTESFEKAKEIMRSMLNPQVLEQTSKFS